MYHTAKLNHQNTRLITLSSHHLRTKSNKKIPPQKICNICPLFELDSCQCKKIYKPSQVGTKAYKDALQHSFNVASERIFKNPDMTYFVTFTYKDNITDVDKVLQDIKIFIKSQKRKMSNLEQSAPAEKKKQTQKIKQNRKTNISGSSQAMNGKLKANSLDGLHHENIGIKRATDSIGVTPKYIFILEKQKRGAIHVHMICNGFFDFEINENGYKQLKDWKHGFTSVLEIKDFDKNFKPFLYLFKYMRKSQRVGRSFVHSSRNLDNYKHVDYDGLNLKEWRLTHSEIREYAYTDEKGKTITNYYYKNFYERILLE